MTRHIKTHGLCAALLLTWFCATSPASERRETPAVRAIKRARTAVVNIHSEKTAPSGDSLFSAGKNRKISGMGTGIVVDERGYIVTNYHVVADVDSLRVTLNDGASYTAQVVSYDKREDLAIIKIAASKPMDLMPMGTSSDLMLAETVIAVGNAFGYEDSVTLGIISSLSRDVDVNEEQSYRNLIQTDASINPGNSGGPLINLDGEVIGINVAIRAGAQRIGFAIPIDDARRVIAKLLSIEQLSQTQHGLHTTDVKDGTKRELVVKSTEPGSPAQSAGFQPGDTILKVAKTKVVDGVDLERALIERSAGEKVDVVVRRNDHTETLSLALAPYNNGTGRRTSDMVVRGNNPSESVADRAWRELGIRLSPMPESKNGLVRPRYNGGMFVDGVRANSSAALNGIRQGDILVGLHVWETTNLENVTFILEHPEYRSFSPLKFYILRGAETLYGHLTPSTQLSQGH